MDKILLVDESEFFIVLIKSLLDARGCKVITANNAAGEFCRKLK